MFRSAHPWHDAIKERIGPFCIDQLKQGLILIIDGSPNV
jgi:hypothetical protein